MTQEVCAIISAKAKGRVKSQKHCEEIRKSMLGKNTGPRTDEVKLKLHLANLGKKQSRETIKRNMYQ